MLKFYQLDKNCQLKIKEQAKSKRRGTAGVAQGKSAHVLDAANYVKTAWDKISSTTIRIAFIKADLQINYTNESNETKTQTKDDEVNVSELSELLKKLQISLTNKEFIDFTMMDDENSPEYISAILEELSAFLEELEDSTTDNQQVGETSGIPVPRVPMNLRLKMILYRLQQIVWTI